MFLTQPADRIRTALVVATTALVVACGGSDGDTETTDAGTSSVSSDAATTSTDESGGSSDVLQVGDSDGLPERESFEILSLPAGLAQFPILGGIELQLPEASKVIQGSGCILVEMPGYTGSSPFAPTVSVAEVRFTGRNTPVLISTIDEWIALYEGQPEPALNGETLNALGAELTGYRVDGAYPDGPPPDDRLLNCTANAGSVSGMAYLPAPIAEVFVAEADGALVMVGAGAFTEDELDDVRRVFDQIVPTLKLTTP